MDDELNLMRAEFEREMRKNYGEEHFVKVNTPFDGICYTSPRMNGAFDGWLAARRAAPSAEASAGHGSAEQAVDEAALETAAWKFVALAPDGSRHDVESLKRTLRTVIGCYLDAALSRKAEQPAEADINGLIAEIEAQPGGKEEVAKAREWAREQIAEMGAQAEELPPLLARIQGALDLLADAKLPMPAWRDVSNVLHACRDAIAADRASRAAEAQGEGLTEVLTTWLCREMPAGTVIGDPAWWAPKIARAIAAHLRAAGQPEVPNVDAETLIQWIMMGCPHIELQSNRRIMAQHVRNLAAGKGRDGELMRFAKWVLKRGPELPDHACAECVPHSDMLKHGFKCVFHAAVGLLHEVPATKGEKGGAA